MQRSTLIKRSLTYYWRTNIAVVLGVACAVAVLAGALLVGDSVRGSLRNLFLQRLGNADYVISSAGFFREGLSDDLRASEQFAGRFEAACPLIVFEGVVEHDTSGRRGSDVQVYGVDDRFWDFHGESGGGKSLGDRETMVSASLSEELGVKAGDSLLVRIEKPSDIPSESLHGRKEDLGRTIRLSIREVLPGSALGEFSLRPQQGAVRAVFVPLARLQKDLEAPGKVNAILVAEKAVGDKAGDFAKSSVIEQAIRATFKLEDLGLKVRAIEGQGSLALESESALVNDALEDTARVTAARVNASVTPVLSYLANEIRLGERAVPYSIATAVDDEAFAAVKGGGGSEAERMPPILLNDWTARELSAKPGDVVTLEYYLWEQEGRLSTRTAEFRVAGAIPITGAAADRDLVPEYPGITGTESLSDWDPPFPMDLGRIRPVDEDYWDTYRTTPKAFIPLAAGQKLWSSRFGDLTSLRIRPSGGTDLQAALASFRDGLRADVDPIQMGLAVNPTRAQGLEASRGATDFGEYFIYFSFFLVVSALLLTALFFKLGIEQRSKEVGLLRSVGFPAKRIRNLFLSEGLILAAAGSLLGLAGALGYGWFVMFGLRTWWVDAVGTTALDLHVSPSSLILGGLGGVVTSLAVIAWTLRSLAPASPRSLLTGAGMSAPASEGAGAKRGRRFLPARFGSIHLSVIFAACGVLLLAGALLNLFGQVAGFFGAGTLLLISALFYLSAWLRKDKRTLLSGGGLWAVSRLGFRNTTYRPGRSVLCIALIASATFIIVAVDAFRRDGRDASLDRKSGGGGFPLLAESLLPLVHDPATAEGKEALSLHSQGENALDGVTFERFRLRPGDDASCLNLYQPKNPRILGASEGFVKGGRFGFQSSLALSPEEKENPWLLLDKDPGDGSVPVIADANSMTYVLHLGLGDEFVLNQGTNNPIRLRLVGALSDSIFQSELLMSEANFLRLFPEQEGYRFFLIDTAPERAQEVAGVLEESLSDFGFDAMPTGERLAAFHRVENTYLSTFQTLGGLGLVLGTLGLATVLLRNILERRKEMALLRAVGYEYSHFAVMVIAENALLLLFGLAAGTLCALLAIAPAFLSRGGRLPTLTLALLLLVVLATGIVTSLAATSAALRDQLLSALRAE
ncbi:MAG TPA: ABC transporter permease [Blastocatellia bacterium]|nr:ABC transporter permease [Blastocatellia bacterium]